MFSSPGCCLTYRAPPKHTLHNSFFVLAWQLGAPEDAELNVFTINSLFSTLTNVNFSEARFKSEYIPKVQSSRITQESACRDLDRLYS